MNEPILPQIVPIPNSKIKDITGQRYGRLCAIGYVGTNYRGNSLWLCLCDCGKSIAVDGCCLRNGNTQSCGCYQKSLIAEQGKRKRKHGMRNSPEYVVWRNMLLRCEDPNADSYPLYGARGIKVCDEWHSFENFISDVGRRPSKNHSLDRIDNNGNYEKLNVRWVTVKQQANNRRSNRHIEHDGVTRTLAEWADIVGLGYNTLWHRLNVAKWTVERALHVPCNSEKQPTA